MRMKVRDKKQCHKLYSTKLEKPLVEHRCIVTNEKASYKPNMFRVFFFATVDIVTRHSPRVMKKQMIEKRKLCL